MKNKHDLNDSNIFIFGRTVANTKTGKMNATGSNPKILIDADHFANDGEVKTNSIVRQSWLRTHLSEITVAVIAGLILYYIFGIK